MKRLVVSSLFFILLLLGGCSRIPTPIERQMTLETLAHEQNLTLKTIPTERFDLTSIVSAQCESKSMRVYIEGDGFTWATRSRLSSDPTPINPIASKLMMIDQSGCKAYLARPCQYQQSKACNERYWSSHRFSSEVIHSYGEALDQFKKEYNIESFTLIGYSGGGAVAALTASKRNDVRELITVAGNIDTDVWVKNHGISPLEGSLNPAKAGERLGTIPQTHLIGSKDTIIPLYVYESYKKYYPLNPNITSIICTECTHNEGWIQMWRSFLNEDIENLRW